MTEVWLAEKSGGIYGNSTLGIFSEQEKAEQVCQDNANDYLGAKHTPPLQWRKHEGHGAATYTHPAGGAYVFQVTRFTVDEVLHND